MENKWPRWQRPLNWFFSVLGGLGLWGLLLHRSLEPFLWGYSLPWLLVLGGYLVVVALLAGCLRRYGPKLHLVLFSNLLMLVVVLALVESVGQIDARLHPAFTTLFLEPDPVLGWRHVPNFRWVVRDNACFVPQFDNTMETNAHGFRDKPRSMEKSAGTQRVALIGDSLVEAVQVPLEKTAGMLLERRLNQAGTGADKGRWEVLNFGVSNYGIGQFYLNWKENARRFSPDYVFVLVAGFHMHRTVMSSERAVLSSSGASTLEVRPTFEWKNGRLIDHPPRDFEKFKAAQESVIRGPWGGSRTHPAPLEGCFLGDLKKRLFLANGMLLRIQRKLGDDGGHSKKSFRFWPDFTVEALDLNMAILNELARDIRQSGARMVLVDVHEYAHQGDLAFEVSDPLSKGLSQRLRQFCEIKDAGYINLSEPLLEANRKGLATAWIGDGHFNERGHQVFAEAMQRWLLAHASHP